MEAPASLLTRSFVMLLLSVLVLVPGCLATLRGGGRLSPDTMRDLLSRAAPGVGLHEQIPHVYQQLVKIYAYPDSITSSGNTARPYMLNPKTGKITNKCLKLLIVIFRIQKSRHFLRTSVYFIYVIDINLINHNHVITHISICSNSLQWSWRIP